METFAFTTTSEVPDELVDGHVFDVLGTERVLLTKTESGTTSYIFKMLNENDEVTVDAITTARFGALQTNSFALVKNKYLVAVGNQQTHVYDVEMQHAVQPRWPRPDLAAAVEGVASVVTPDGGVYMIGGRHRTSHFLSDGVEYRHVQYSTEVDWIRLASLRFPRRDAKAVYVAASTSSGNEAHMRTPSHKLVVVGGYFWDRTAVRYRECPHTEVYDGGRWIAGPPLRIPRRYHSAAVLPNHTIVVLGGVTGQGRLVDEIEVWNMNEMNRFVIIGNLPYSRQNFTAVCKNSDDVYFFGGGERAIDKITFDPGKLTGEALRALEPHAPPMDESQTILLHEVPDTAVQESEPQEANSTQREESSQTTGGCEDLAILRCSSGASESHGIETTKGYPILRNPLAPILPIPPTRPRQPASGTVLERCAALKEYIASLQALQDEYKKTMENTIQQTFEAYERACSQTIESVRVHGEAWFNDTERLIGEAKKQLSRSEAFVETLIADRPGRDLLHILRENGKDAYDDNIPSQLRCPITLTLMTDPVVAADGNTYERKALEAWFAACNDRQATSPLTGAELPSRYYLPVYTLKLLCQQYANSG